MTFEEKMRTLTAEGKYDFLHSNPLLGNNIAILGVGGSYAYGTDIDESDIDLRGCAMETPERIISGDPFERFDDEDTDTVIYGTRKFITLLSKSSPNIMEILGYEKYLIVSEAGQRILDNKELFMSKDVYRTFGGYTSGLVHSLEKYNSDSYEFAEAESRLTEYMEHIGNDMGLSFSVDGQPHTAGGDFLADRIRVSGTLTGIPFNVLCDTVDELRNTVKGFDQEHHKNKRAARRGKLGKHMSHLLRLYMMGAEILGEGKITVYRDKERELLRDVRLGKYQDENGAMKREFFEIASSYEENLRSAYLRSELPPYVDDKKIEKFLVNLYKDFTF